MYMITWYMYHCNSDGKWKCFSYIITYQLGLFETRGVRNFLFFTDFETKPLHFLTPTLFNQTNWLTSVYFVRVQ